MLLTAAFVVVNQLNGFTSLGIGNIIAAVFALAFFVLCIAQLNFAPIPIPLAVLYIVFQKPLELPHIKIWTLILAAVLASIGLAALLPKKYRHNCTGFKRDGRPVNNNFEMRTKNINNNNNPSVSVNFSGISRRLQAESLETIQLYCNFGAMEIFLDQVKLNPGGTEAVINCSFGAVKLFVPKHWNIIDNINCNLGGVDIEKQFTIPAENASKFTLTGNVSFGGIEVRYI